MSEIPTQPSSLPPELDARLARIEASVGTMLELMKAWADEQNAIRERLFRVERELAEERQERKRLSARVARVERATELDGPRTEPGGLAPPEPEHVT